MFLTNVLNRLQASFYEYTFFFIYVYIARIFDITFLTFDAIKQDNRDKDAEALKSKSPVSMEKSASVGTFVTRVYKSLVTLRDTAA